MLEINLWDNTFAHLQTPDGKYSMVHKKVPKNIKYVCKKTNYDGITIFTDHFLNPVYIKSVKSKFKVGWYIERCEINRTPKMMIENYINELDFLMTNDSDILDKYPNKAKFVPFGGTWILEENCKMHDKNSNISMIYSNKKNTFQGYNIRHSAAESLKSVVDLYGNGSPNPIELKEYGLKDYKYTIVVENLKKQNYFTEKLVDAFMVGAVPIYWGCPNIGDFFDINGIITFDSVEELKDIADNKLENFYENNTKSIVVNHHVAKQYAVTEDWFYHNIFKECFDV
tara:strand:- start:7845 stop:8696 length:852 start_codon:yes stop_codon:yes gene_type:complete